MTELNFYELAKQGNPQAIASLLESQLQSEGITAAVNLNGDCLDVIFDAEQIPAPEKLVEVVGSKLMDLQPDSIRKVKLEGRENGNFAVAWTQKFSLNSGTLEPEKNEEVVANTAFENNSNFPDNASNPEEIQPEIVGLENRLRSTLIVVGIVTGILAIAVVVFVNKTWNESAANVENNLDKTANSATTPDTFRAAVNSAVKAADLGRSAKTKEDWNSVVDRWQEAVSLMRRVPPSSPHHQVAQTKVVEYQKYLLYAQESAVNPSPPTPTPTTPEKATSKKSNSENSSRKKLTSEKETSSESTPKKSTSEKSSPEKANPSR
ncbi:MAG: hypothetical protein HC789_08835 [Microcoleus sp. CSU_2_2]|nr:hypothetical protein [Microcoleus sp. SU_5_3]NJS10468.1 hypothetical protein [Microcoleus sp. CSU_2_2]